VTYLVERSAPETSLTPDAITRMSQSSRAFYLYPLLVFSFTFAPIAEEMFFRGFLQNAFRQRMPLALAVVAQSMIFGACHSFGAIHSAYAVALGLLLTLLYEWRQTLITPIAVHMAINAVAALGIAGMAAEYANSPVLGVNGDPSGAECVIRELVPGSAADKAGLQVGDIVTSFNGQPVRNFQHLRETVRRCRPGDLIPIEITRSGLSIEVNAILERRGAD
jgi:membrane-associated protease RseP (regulator of RpoE activity)